MKRVLITGANGNLGGAMVKEIIEATDYEILAVANSHEKISEMIAREKIVDRSRIQSLSQDEFFGQCWHCDIAVHMAFARANRSNEEIAGSLDYMKRFLAHLCPESKLVYISSQSVYGNTSEIRKESLPPAPASVYSMAKYAGEKLLEVKGKGTYTTLRLDYVIQSQKLVPVLCKSAKEKGIINLQGGKQTFSYIDRVDVAKAIVALLQTESQWKPIYNVGPNRMRYTLVEMANVVKEVAEKHGKKDVQINLVETETELWSGMDSSLFMTDTGWEPSMDIYHMVEAIYEKVC